MSSWAETRATSWFRWNITSPTWISNASSPCETRPSATTTSTLSRRDHPLSDDPGGTVPHVHAREPSTGVLSLTSVLHHLDTGWQLRHRANVVMCHYADFSADLPGEIVRLAEALDIDTNADRAQELAAEATLDRMRDRADDVLPNAGAIWNDDRAFFRAGGFGEWRSRVNEDDLAEYDKTVDAIASPELATWAHHGRLASGTDPAHA